MRTIVQTTLNRLVKLLLQRKRNDFKSWHFFIAVTLSYALNELKFLRWSGLLSYVNLSVEAMMYYWKLSLHVLNVTHQYTWYGLNLYTAYVSGMSPAIKLHFAISDSSNSLVLLYTLVSAASVPIFPYFSNWFTIWLSLYTNSTAFFRQ